MVRYQTRRLNTITTTDILREQDSYNLYSSHESNITESKPDISNYVHPGFVNTLKTAIHYHNIYGLPNEFAVGPGIGRGDLLKCTVDGKKLVIEKVIP